MPCHHTSVTIDEGSRMLDISQLSILKIIWKAQVVSSRLTVSCDCRGLDKIGHTSNVPGSYGYKMLNFDYTLPVRSHTWIQNCRNNYCNDKQELKLGRGLPRDHGAICVFLKFLDFSSDSSSIHSQNLGTDSIEVPPAMVLSIQPCCQVFDCFGNWD